MRISSALLGTVLAFGLLGTFQPTPSHAQTRPAIVRDQDNPALAPFTGSAQFIFTAINTQQVITTVPAGKRLVITNLTYLSGNAGSVQLVFLGLRAGSFGPILHVFQINPPHASVTPGITIQDGGTPIVAYFEAGQDVVVSASVTSPNSGNISVYLTGYYITP